MEMRKLQLLAAGIVLLSFITAIYFYPQLPARVATHWDINGNPNGYSSGALGGFFLPILSLALLALFLAIPHLDPLKKNYAAFRNEYDGMMVVLLGFMYYIYAISLAANLGYNLNMIQLLSPAFAALFFYLGMLLSKAKQNWFVGIRTPWTLSSEKVWDKTHRMVSLLFKAAGVVALIGIFLPRAGLAIIVAMAIAIAVFSFVYSYVLFRKEEKQAKKKK